MKISRSATLVLACLFIFAAGSASAAKYKVSSGGVTYQTRHWKRFILIY